jgi:hypothetical protein
VEPGLGADAWVAKGERRPAAAVGSVDPQVWVATTSRWSGAGAEACWAWPASAAPCCGGAEAWSRLLERGAARWSAGDQPTRMKSREEQLVFLTKTG